MTFLYNLGIRLYICLVAIASPFNEKARLWRKGRKGIFSQIKKDIDTANRHVWFHCASLGEFEQGRPVIEAFRANHPEFKIVLTFFSPSGYEIRKNYAGADHIYYLPSDLKSNARKFIQLIQPEKAFFIKYEFWHNYLKTLNDNKIPTYIFSAIFRADQLFFKSYGAWYRKMLGYFTHIFVQNEGSKNLLASIGFQNVTVSGDTRFDRVYSIAQQTREIPLVSAFSMGKFTIIAGSTWDKDEELLIQFINSSKTGTKFIIAPHEIPESNIQRIIGGLKKKIARYSQADVTTVQDADVLLIDNIGMLSSLYKYGKIAYIGGGFGKGIHNILEAATFGLPILFGPTYQKFQEAKDLIDLKGAYSISNFEELQSKLDHLIADETLRKQSGDVCRNYVETKRGATDMILHNL
jgi:3-deoxy-D-manno-octulosonic-acid transferase